MPSFRLQNSHARKLSASNIHEWTDIYAHMKMFFLSYSGIIIRAYINRWLKEKLFSFMIISSLQSIDIDILKKKMHESGEREREREEKRTHTATFCQLVNWFIRDSTFCRGRYYVCNYNAHTLSSSRQLSRLEPTRFEWSTCEIIHYWRCEWEMYNIGMSFSLVYRYFQTRHSFFSHFSYTISHYLRFKPETKEKEEEQKKRS